MIKSVDLSSFSRPAITIGFILGSLLSKAKNLPIYY